MAENTVHNPDRYMADLRQVLSQGRKRIGLFVGAGAPVGIKVCDQNQIIPDGKPLIPDVAGLTKIVMGSLNESEQVLIKALFKGKDNANIEDILTKIRKLSHVIGDEKIHGIDGKQYAELAEKICNEIGKIVAPMLPMDENPYSELVSWVGGIDRQHPVEIFTPNYDLLIEEAFERAKLPFFDGFSGTFEPFFDASSLNGDVLPSRWSRVWKIHGSLGWKIEKDSIVRTGDRSAANLIYPEHLKYEHISRQPFSALFERLRNFLCSPDTLLICSGFSFADAHIVSVFEETLASNAHVSILAFQFSSIDRTSAAAKLAMKRPNLSLYGPDAAIVSGVYGKWLPGKPPSQEWEHIRKTYWDVGSSTIDPKFTLGDFTALTRFFALSKSVDLTSSESEVSTESETEAMPQETAENAE